jgi:hypothetical protein
MHLGTSRAVVVALILAGAVGCGSSNSAGNGPEDAGGPTPEASTTQDASLADASQTDVSQPVEASQNEDAGNPDCGAVPPSGTQIVTSTAPLVLQGGGLTSDGYAFYEDANSQILYAVPASGGTPSSLGVVTSQSGTFYRNGGKAVLFLPVAANPVSDIAPLSAWTAATGPKVISTGVLAYDSYGYTYDVSQDGSEVVYFAANGGPTVSLTVTTIGGTPQTLLSSIDLSNGNCLPIANFVGSTIVAEYCLASSASDDGGVPGALTYAAFAGPAFTQTTLATLPAPTPPSAFVAQAFLTPAPVSPDGTKLLISSTSPGLALYPIAGGAPTVINASGGNGAFAQNGDVIYGTDTSALIRYLAGSGAGSDGGATEDGGGTEDGGTEDGGAPGGGNSITLVPSGVYLLTISPDGNWVQVGRATNSTDTLTDIYLASATKQNSLASLTTVWSQTTGYPIGFTADSTFDTLETNVPTTFGDTNFDFEAAPVADGGAATKVVTSAGGLAFTTAAKIVTNLNATPTTGAADIEAIDLANPSAKSVLVTQADPNFFYARATNQVVYSWYCASNASAGVWVRTAP